MMDQRDTPPHMGMDPAVAERARVLEDWVTIWQSEMAALVVDREAQEALLRAGDLWAAQARAAARALAPLLQTPTLQAAPDERAHGRAGADAAAGPAAVDAAPDGRVDGQRQRDGAIEGLLERVAELERRVGCPSPAGAAAGI